jgi:hypothetical protein
MIATENPLQKQNGYNFLKRMYMHKSYTVIDKRIPYAKSIGCHNVR